jgi:hypothetical protein
VLLIIFLDFFFVLLIIYTNANPIVQTVLKAPTKKLIPMDSSDNFDNHLEILDNFFDMVRNKSLLHLPSGTLRQIRTQLHIKLNEILVWGRPHLERTRGLQWPYAQCALIAPELERMYHQYGSTTVAQQALLFLSFLPVPHQWRWLAKAIDILHDEPEIIDFLTTERQTIQAKISEKPQSIFKMRHFVQILKPPRLPHEKGVLRIFSLPYLFLNKQVLRKIADHYVFYVEPPMGAVFRHAWWRIFTELQDPCVFGLGGEEDRHFVSMQANTHVISLAHGDYLRETAPPDPLADKDIDIVFNATFDDMARKRHSFMLQLLKDRRLATKKALFLGRGSQRNVQALKTMVETQGLSDRVIVLSNVCRQDIPLYLTRCKTGVHLSLYENSCRCVYEYFRADIPCVISSVTAGVDMTIFNAQTGRVARDEQLAETIADVLLHRSSYSPRNWFLAHSGSRRNSLKLNKNLAKIFAESGYAWQADIVQLTSSGASRYLKKNHYQRFLPEFRQLLAMLQPSIASSVNLVVDEM